MHIPDGYLSPSTCAVLYAGAAPFWVISLRRMQEMFSARAVPLLSLVSAFSFVIMMFNLPLPGGTSGHAIGVTVATVVLGPWGAILAISMALFIQALFFADGGITAFGANCFNMAVVGSFVSHGVYQWLSHGHSLTSPRRVLAAGLAGYAAINAAALCTAVEFGLQPALFRDAAGAPLYAPFPLIIAVPAMMIGHLTIAGLAEMFISGGLVAHLQTARPDLLRETAPTAPDGVAVASLGISLRPLWIGMAALMIATPLGLLAAGTAWGEWAADDFRDPGTRQAMAKASFEAIPPSAPPTGMERLARVWTAPLPDYAPAFLKNEVIGYLLSALLGTGLVLALFLTFSRIMAVIDRIRHHRGSA